MANVFSVGAEIHLIDRFSAGFAKMAAGFARSQTAADALNAKMSKIGNLFSSGSAMLLGGMALAAPLIKATSEAEKLEASLKNVQNITRANNAEMAKYGPLLTSISHKTAAFSKPMLADFASRMAQGGIRDSKGIQDLMPLFADAADVLKFSKHMDPLQVAEALTSVAHQFGKYSPDADMKKIVSSFVTGMQIAPGTVNQFVRGGSYVNPLGSRIFGMDPTDLMALQIASAQTSGGGGGRGAMSPANQMNVIKRSLPGMLGSGLLDGKSPFALRMMGISDAQGLSAIKSGNKLDLMKLSDKLAAFSELGATAGGRIELAHRMLENAPMLGKKAGEMEQFAKNVLAKNGNVMGAELTMKALQYAFGSGGAFAALLGDKSFRDQLSFVKGRMKNDPSLDQKQQEYSGTLAFSKIQASTDMNSLLADVGMRMLPTVTKVIKGIDMMIFKMDEFVLKHPKITDAIIGITAGLAGLMVTGGVGTMLAAAASGLEFLGGAVASAALAYPPFTIAVVGGVAGMIAIGKNWEKISAWAKSSIYKHSDLIKTALAITLVVADRAGKELQKLAGQIAGFLGKVAGAAAGLVGAFGGSAPWADQMKSFAKDLEDFSKSKPGKDWTNNALDKYAPGLRGSIDGFTGDLKKEYQKQNASAAAHKGAGGPVFGPAVPQISQMKLLHDAAQEYANSKHPARLASGAKVTVVNNTHVVNVAKDAINVSGPDPKGNAHEVLRMISDMRQAAAATTTAGGVATSKYQYGAQQ